MRITVTALQWLIRLLAVVQLTLGVLFWTGNAFILIPLHMLSGLLLVLAIWVQAGLALRSGIHIGLPLLAVAWSMLVIGLGITQDSLLTGDLHWLIKVVHLLVGVAAVGQAEALAHGTLSQLVGERRLNSDAKSLPSSRHSRRSMLSR
jgi:hypothetical protein